ncbi:MAG: DUF3126 family protein [Rhodovibrionaceae bacterium]|nr:DUF3126 family protein [Rhodovibrionaceae bacterium]
MTDKEIAQLQSYLRKTFDCERIKVLKSSRKEDSAEVNIGDEFIGVLYRDEEDGELSYAFQMAILDIDLPTLAN